MDFLNSTSFTRAGRLQSFAGCLQTTLGKLPKELSYVNPKVLEHLTGHQKEVLISELKDVEQLPSAERDPRVQAAVARVLELPPQEDPFCFDALVGEYFSSYELMDYAQQLDGLQAACEQTRDREGLVKKTLSNIRLDIAIQRWGAGVIGAATHEFFIRQVRSGRRDFPLSELSSFNIRCQAEVDQRKRANTNSLDRAIRTMKDEFNDEAVEAARLELEPAILSGMQRVDQRVFKAACEAKDGELAEASRLQSQQRAQRDFDEMVTDGITKVIRSVPASVRNAKKYNLVLTIGLINWVAKTFGPNQVKENLSAAFAHMGMVISTQVSPREAAQLARKYEKTIAKADPVQAFQLAILDRAPDILELDMDEFPAQELGVEDWHLI